MPDIQRNRDKHTIRQTDRLTYANANGRRVSNNRSISSCIYLVIWTGKGKKGKRKAEKMHPIGEYGSVIDY